MTDPVKPRRKVASQISLAPSPSPVTSSSTSSGRTRAHVNPSSVASPSTPLAERPSIRSTPSALSLRSTPVSRARSPAPQSSASTPHARVTTRTPRTPVTSTLPPRSAVGLTPKEGSGTPAAKFRATKSVVDGHSSPRTPDLRRNNTEESASRTRTLSLRSTAGGHSAPMARVRTSGTGTTITPSTPIHPILKSHQPITPAHPHHPQNVTSTHHNATPIHHPHPASTAPSPSIQTPPPAPSQPSPIPNIVSTPTDGGYCITGLGVDDGGLRILQSSWRDINGSPEKMSDSGSHVEVSSNRSSPSRRSPKVLPQTLTSTQHALAYIFQHPTASAPTSPVPSSSPPHTSHRNNIHSKTKLPYHPHGSHPPSLPRPPISPELRTVALPALTPALSSEEWSRTNSSQGYGSVGGTGSRKFSGTSSELSGPLAEMKKDDSRDRLSGATAVDDVEVKLGDVKIGDQDMDVVLGADAEEAKVNRKIADLEISNASLLAINKTLEATKSKQRTEILKLRRMLRESINGNAIPTFSSLHPSTPLSLLTPTIDTFDEDLDPEGAYFDEEMADPQLEARWEKIADLVGNMKRRAETAVEVGKEEIKIGQGRVLGWMEVEKNRLVAEQQEHEMEGDMSVDSITPHNEGEADYAGETSREEVDGVI
ncbi:hypothetical protein I302_103676 [Kwoniella bestiolae CBS 10118]|uniref:Uncharacterized protein n=1 Tax=Kwoniella bestiolae CBS 10118 TaxID=1296100 RepID=A0A1B9G946_9TREE|nr:hypothetical protein I302_02381 [Kwoniella bestiolae CBS 10118]OCF27539.1 hypothetical protein I302_02381 [Kwoniella bestiolae CBS 10118]